MAASAIRAGRAFVELFADSTRLVSGLKVASRRLQRFGDQVRNVGASLARIGTIGALPFAGATAVFADLETQLVAIQARLDAAGRGQGFERLDKRIRELGASTVFSTREVASAAFEFTKAGFSIEEQLDALGPALDLAVSGQLELADATKTITQLMRSMEIPTRDVTKVTDALGFAANSAQTDILQLGEAFGKVSGLAATLGISYDELAISTARLQELGQQGSEAGTGLRGVLISLVRQGPKAIQFAKRFGVDAAALARLDIVEIFRAVNREIGDLPGPEQAAILSQFFENRQIATAINLSKGIEQIARDLDSARKNAKGFNRTITGRQVDTLQGRLKILQSQLEGIAVQIGTALNPVLRDFGDFLSRTASLVSDLTSANADIIPTIFKWTAGIAAGGAALFALGPVISAVGTGIGILGTALGGVISLLGFLPGPLGLIGGALGAATIAFVDFGKLGERVLGQLKFGFGAIAETVTTAFGAISEAVKSGDLESASRILTASLSAIWAGLTASLQLVMEELIKAVKDAFDDLQAESSSGFLNYLDRGLIEAPTLFISNKAADFTKGLEDRDAAFRKGFLQFQRDIGLGSDAELARRIAAIDAERTARIAGIEAERGRVRDEIIGDQQAQEAARVAQAQAQAERDKAENARKAAAAQEKIKKELRAQLDAFKAIVDEEKQRRDLAKNILDFAVQSKRAIQAGPGLLDSFLDETFGGRARQQQRERLAEVAVGLGEFFADAFPQALEQVQEQIRTLDPRQQADVTGSFNAFGLQGIGFGENLQRQTLDEQREANRLLGRIEDAVQEGQQFQ